MSPKFTDVSRQLRSMAQHNVDVIMLQKTLVGADRVAHWKRYLITEPFYEDQTLAAYATDPLSGRYFTLTEELVPGLGPIRVITSTDCLDPGRVMQVDVGWGTTARLNQTFDVEITLTSDVRAFSQRETYPLSPDWPTAQWPAHTIAWGNYPMQTPTTLPNSTYTLTLSLIDRVTGTTQGKTAVLGTVSVDEDPCAFPAPHRCS
jgi:hypothetical protein